MSKLDDVLNNALTGRIIKLKDEINKQILCNARLKKERNELARENGKLRNELRKRTNSLRDELTESYDLLLQDKLCVLNDRIKRYLNRNGAEKTLVWLDTIDTNPQVGFWSE